METSEKCGVYAIRCEKSGKLYVGSSSRIYRRWYEHRRSLRVGKHHSHRLQRAWVKHGAECFTFLILEECVKEVLEEREQWHIDALCPNYNVITDVRAFALSKEIEVVRRANHAAAHHALALARTHCPHGHLYDEANTFIGKKGEKICRICNAIRVKAIWHSMSSEQRERALVYRKEHYQKNREAMRAKQAEYTAANREKKREYDRLHRAEATVRKRRARENETPLQRELRLQQKRESHQRHREANLAKMRDRYRRGRDMEA